MILPLDSDLLPVVDKSYWREINADEGMQRDERARCSVEPWYWLVNYVYTVRGDEGVEGGAIERFPSYEYLRYIFHQFFIRPKLAVDKSRQVLLSLIAMAWSVYLCQYKEHEEIVCQSDKKEKADQELIYKRAYRIYKYQPSYLKPKALYTCAKLDFPETDSRIVGIPAGDRAGDQIRSFTPTRVILDECGFYEGNFEDCRTAALACCKDIKLISSANGGEWDAFINDNLN